MELDCKWNVSALPGSIAMGSLEMLMCHVATSSPELPGILPQTAAARPTSPTDDTCPPSPIPPAPARPK